MSEQAVAIILAFVTSGAFVSILNLLFNIWKEKRDKESGIAAGVRIILYDRIKWFGKKHIEAGYISQEDLEDLITMHKIYHDELDGNGYLDAVMDNVKHLPFRK